MKPLSIKLRLSLLVSLLTVTIIVVVSVVSYVEQEESLLRNVDEILRAMGEGIAVVLDDPQDAESRKAELRSILGDPNGPSRTWCRIWADGNDSDWFVSGLTGGPHRDGFLDPPSEKRPRVGETSFLNVVDQTDQGKKAPYRALWMRRMREQTVVNVLVGRSSRHVYHELREFYRLLLIVGGSLTLLAFLAVPVLISWGLNPVAQASAQLGAITHKSLGQARQRSEIAPELKPFMAALDDMLGRLDQAMQQQGQFIADAAHELRTPVAVLKCALQTTNLQWRTAAEYKAGIEEALQDVERLERLVEQLLSLARLERPDRLRRSVRLRLDALLAELADVYDVRAARQNGRVIMAQTDAVWVRGDESELRQLFANLLDNALRYGPEGGTVTISMEDRPDGELAVSVHDQGGRIPNDALVHLFDRFYRVDSSRSQDSGGSGLGLPIAREIACRHGGDIEITSNPQTGTLVSVRLPRR